MTTVSTNIVSTLGGGSGIDIKALAQNLANAEMQPQIDGVNTKISQTQAQISAYGYIKTALLDLENAFKNLDDATDFASVTSSVSQPSAIGITTTAGAPTGSYSLTINQVAQGQITASNNFAASDSQLNAGNPFSLQLSIHGGDAQTIDVTTATPAGVVSAINDANLGVTAELINTGDANNPYTVVVSGQTGAANDFSLTSSTGDLSFNFTPNLQDAVDASLTYNGLAISRSNNEISDLINGVTLNLYSATTGAARIDLSRNTQSITDNLNTLVTAYNDLETTLSELQDPKSTFKDPAGEQVGGSLATNSILQTIRSMVHGLITNTSTTPSGTMTAARDVGLSFDRNGQLTLDSTKLNSALQNNFSDFVTMFTAGTSGKSIYSTAPSGVAGDAVVKLDAMLRTGGLITTSTDNASQKVTNYKDQLTTLNDRLTQIQDRYTQQFAAMDALIGNIRSTQAGLTNSFAGMMATYTNKG